MSPTVGIRSRSGAKEVGCGMKGELCKRDKIDIGVGLGWVGIFLTHLSRTPCWDTLMCQTKLGQIPEVKKLLDLN